MDVINSSDADRKATTMTFHLTAGHQQILSRVLRHHYAWRPDIGPSGGFVQACGGEIPIGDELVKLYELRNARLITVATDTGSVSVTPLGLARIAQACAQQQRSAS